jgi:hypothetical protein
LFQHEYGHTFDSRIFGVSYLFAIGIPSLISVAGSELIPENNPNNLYTHNIYWTEMRANRHAAEYFKKYFGIDWEALYPEYPLNNPF